MNQARGPIVGTLAVAACCGAGTLIASGALAALVGAVTRWWPLLAAGVIVLGYAALRVHRKLLRQSSTTSGRRP